MSRKMDYSRATSGPRRFTADLPVGRPKPPTKAPPRKILVFKVGDQVRDRKFGPGCVLKNKKGAFVRVQFRNYRLGGNFHIRSYTYFEALQLERLPLNEDGPMAMKKTSLDAATVKIMKQVLAMSPKPHDGQKIGRPTKKKRGPKDRASSSKKPTV